MDPELSRGVEIRQQPEGTREGGPDSPKVVMALMQGG